MEELQSIKFDYTKLDNTTAEFLKVKESNMRRVTSDAIAEIGRELKEAQERLAKHGYGCFGEWVESIGISDESAYNYMRYAELISKQFGERQLIESLPKRLAYDIAKPSTDPELKEQVLSGDIKTHKEYQEAVKAKQEAEFRASEAEIRLKAHRDIIKARDEKINKLTEQVKQKIIVETREVEKIPEDYEQIKQESQKVLKLEEQLKKEREEKNNIKLEAQGYKEHIKTNQGNTYSHEAKDVIDFQYAVREFMRKVSHMVYLGEMFLGISNAELEAFRREVDMVEKWCIDMGQAIQGKNGGANLIILEGRKNNG